MESDTPIDLLASRVWSGSKWHYPHIEAMLSEIERLRDELSKKVEELAAMRKQRDEARRLYCVEMSRQSTNPTRFTPEWGANELGWDCFKEGGGA